MTKSKRKKHKGNKGTKNISSNTQFQEQKSSKRY